MRSPALLFFCSPPTHKPTISFFFDSLAKFQYYTNMSPKQQTAWQQAADFGIDTQQLKDNLELSYDERAKQHQQALDTLLKLKEAKRQYDKSQQPS